MLGCCSPLPVSPIRHIAPNISRRASETSVVGDASSRPRYCSSRAVLKPKNSGVHRVVGPRHLLCLVDDVGEGEVVLLGEALHLLRCVLRLAHVDVGHNRDHAHSPPSSLGNAGDGLAHVRTLSPAFSRSSRPTASLNLLATRPLPYVPGPARNRTKPEIRYLFVTF
jgi:hypothetical protein